MTPGSFRVLPSSCLGIDIGTSALKVMELSRWGKRLSVKNYGEMQAGSLYDRPFRTAEKNSLSLSSKDLARALQGIIEEAKMQTRRAVFSIPDFSSFFAHFELPPMADEEIPQAVQYEARKFVPIPFSEVTFDWQIINNRKGVRKNDPAKILLVAVPNEVINQYREIAELAKLRLLTLEAEVFCVIRSCAREAKGSVILLDMGVQTTTINVVTDGILRNSRSVDLGGGSFAERVSQSFSIDRKRAEEQKNLKGLADPQIFQILAPLLDEVVADIRRVEEGFRSEGPVVNRAEVNGEHQKKIGKILLAGGSALLPGLAPYLKDALGIETQIADPFREIFYLPALESRIKSMGPAWAVSAGAALRGLE
ncbi:MAG: type IV pilus assembly protein PilM [Candidatus Wildermuthbacteria bacterium]|nr:type IV pilus assembly protein PilM [Candidatus Wildermuthbacteria bacterium]